MQKRLLELLDKATKVEDMLKIEVQLNKVESEIERISARLANSNKRVDFATFTIQLCHIEVSEREAIALALFLLRKAQEI
jgi:urocanate hydratase